MEVEDVVVAVAVEEGAAAEAKAEEAEEEEEVEAEVGAEDVVVVAGVDAVVGGEEELPRC